MFMNQMRVFRIFINVAVQIQDIFVREIAL